jgi:hypothetical protein
MCQALSRLGIQVSNDLLQAGHVLPSITQFSPKLEVASHYDSLTIFSHAFSCSEMAHCAYHSKSI